MTKTDAGADWRAYSGSGLPPILDAALDCFVEHGYHGTTIRTVASRAGLSVPGLYHHYASKQALLVAIVSYAMDDLWVRSSAALEEAGTDVRGRLDLLVECLVLFHAHQRDLAFIAASEIRSLNGEARDTYIAARDRQQRLMDQVIAAGVAQGVFTTAYPREVSRAIVTMCTGVSQWYRAEGEHTPQELAARYCEMTRRTVGALSPSRS
ncbi:TetR/AcrR family transcriptional regulator [Streptomyces sp. NA04227]|uniref:TetR/AcrR family transcriptional regulator n=1 Tax=Streptomyces sp. NA04227 TaxID=2742136 RepID=UPI0020CA921E|nr:TetR/AcrR family transcriptional regulator [Streptomyces sp. NA04227]